VASWFIPHCCIGPTGTMLSGFCPSADIARAPGLSKRLVTSCAVFVIGRPCLLPAQPPPQYGGVGQRATVLFPLKWHVPHRTSWHLEHRSGNGKPAYPVSIPRPHSTAAPLGQGSERHTRSRLLRRPRQEAFAPEQRRERPPLRGGSDPDRPSILPACLPQSTEQMFMVVRTHVGRPSARFISEVGRRCRYGGIHRRAGLVGAA
jgi:hypothetical protein